jgi:hypothetical protein
MSTLSATQIQQAIENLKFSEAIINEQIKIVKTAVDNETDSEEKIGLYNDLKVLESAKESIDDALGTLESFF